MNKTLGYGSLIVLSGVLLVTAVAQPELLSDKNIFLQQFVNHELLNVLGVILAITLASAGQLHLKFNEIEERYKHRGLNRTRGGVHKAAYWLIGLFLIAIAVVVIKPMAADTSLAQSMFNGAAIFILCWNVFVLITLTYTTFNIKSDISDS